MSLKSFVDGQKPDPYHRQRAKVWGDCKQQILGESLSPELRANAKKHGDYNCDNLIKKVLAGKSIDITCHKHRDPPEKCPYGN